MFWILICENIVTIDNRLGTEVSTHLNLGSRLQSYMDANLSTTRRHRTLEKCCDDPLSFHLKPGSKHSQRCDGDTCNDRYEVVADETGYLNRKIGLTQNDHMPIDIFVAGDSVLQGIGMPSVLESVQELIATKIWNLSLGNYGPRQKINALITYALPRRPRWVVVEFYSGNDVSDAIEYDLCERVGDFRCAFNDFEVRREIFAHPIYRTLAVESESMIHTFDYYAENYFNIAITRHTIHTTKDIIRKKIRDWSNRSPARNGNNDNFKTPNEILARPAGASVEFRPGKLLDWVKAGMAVTHNYYEHLITKMAETERPPTVILIYNPSGYEIYRDILLPGDSELDSVAAFQFEAQRSFTNQHGWLFLDLTEPLRDEVKESKTWIYGPRDGVHWSHKGTAIVARILARELLRVVGQDKRGFNQSRRFVLHGKTSISTLDSDC